MRKKLEKYSKYKDSGLSWLGSVPSEWSIVRNKEIFKERGSVSNTGKETLLTVSHITGVTPRSEKNVNMFTAETMVGYKICHKGDLIINTMWAWMGALGTCNELGICSPSYNVYMPQKSIPYNRRYFDYLFRIPNAVMEMTRNSKGIVSSRLRLYAKDFFQIETALPSLKEQEAIAHYLDTKTAQIDRKIDLLTQKAQRYEELKRSLINETVTRGLDKSVSMRDSGIEWIGDIPRHWKVEKIKRLTSVKRGASPRPIDDPKYFDDLNGEYGWVRIEDVTKSSKYLLETKEKLSTLGISKSVKMKPDDIFLSIAGSVGKPIISKISCCIHDGFVYFVGLKQDVEFMFYIFNCKNIFSGLGKIGTQLNLNTEIVGGISIPLPPIEEQHAIATYLDTKTAQIDQIIQTINTQIEKLKELRKTLINDVVTGKIKVTPDY